MSPNTVRAHTALLETLFLVTTLPAWSHNLLSRVVKTPKAYVNDTGLLCFLVGADAQRLADDGATAASVFSGDLRGLRHLRDKLGPRFKAGVVLYTGEQTVPFEDRLAAVPLGGLWAQASQA